MAKANLINLLILILGLSERYWHIDGKIRKIETEARLHVTYRYVDGKLHCADGPAIEYDDGTKMWYHYGRLHRADGPAIEWATGEHWYYTYGELVGPKGELV